MTTGNELKSPQVGRKTDLPPPPAQQQLQLQAQSLDYERARLEEEKAAFEKIKKDLKDLLDGIKVHERSYVKVGSWSRKHRGSFSNLYKVESSESIPKVALDKEKKEEKKDKEKDKEKKKKDKESKKKEKALLKEEIAVGKDISMPFNVHHKLHVDFDYKWTGQDPEDVFELTQKLGEGYVLFLHSTHPTPSHHIPPHPLPFTSVTHHHLSYLSLTHQTPCHSIYMCMPNQHFSFRPKLNHNKPFHGGVHAKGDNTLTSQLVHLTYLISSHQCDFF
jgi:hypothetical protein